MAFKPVPVQLIEDVMEFYGGFSWAVPKAFKDAVASCLFWEGDMLFLQNRPMTVFGVKLSMVLNMHFGAPIKLKLPILQSDSFLKRL